MISKSVVRRLTHAAPSPESSERSMAASLRGDALAVRRVKITRSRFLHRPTASEPDTILLHPPTPHATVIASLPALMGIPPRDECARIHGRLVGAVNGRSGGRAVRWTVLQALTRPAAVAVVLTALPPDRLMAQTGFSSSSAVAQREFEAKLLERK